MNTELEGLKIFLSAFGGSGIAFFIAWFIFRRWSETLKEKDAILMGRIAILEKAEEACIKERTALYTQMFTLQSTIINQNTEVLHQVLKQLSPV